MLTNNQTTKITPELFNLLTLPFADDVEDYTKEEILDLIQKAFESINK